MVYKDKFIDPEHINEIIRMIQEMAAEQGFTAALVGGVAMQSYGSDRLTMDVDFALDREPSVTGNLTKIKPLGFGGESYRASNGAKVDLIVRNDEYSKLYENALENIGRTEGGTPIVSPGHLAAMKLAAGREKDILDLKWMIGQPDLLDIRVRSIVYRFMGRYAQDRFDDIVDQVAIQKELRRKRGQD